MIEIKKIHKKRILKRYPPLYETKRPKTTTIHTKKTQQKKSGKSEFLIFLCCF